MRDYGSISAGTPNEVGRGVIGFSRAGSSPPNLSGIRTRATPIRRDPAIETSLHRLMEDLVIRTGKWRSQSAVVERARIVHAVDLQHRNGSARRELHEIESASHRSDCCNEVRSFGSEPMRHDSTVRMPGRVDAPSIDRRASLQIIDDSDSEADVIDFARQRVPAATVARVPREQAARQRSAAVRVDDEKALAIRDCVELGVLLKPGGVSAAAVKREHHSRSVHRSRRDMDHVRARSSGVSNCELVVAGSELAPGNRTLRLRPRTSRGHRHADCKGREVQQAFSSHGCLVDFELCAYLTPRLGRKERTVLLEA